MRNKGFTLIELMIVIAIIAIIAAIAIPNLKEAQRNANETAAVTSVRQYLSAQGTYHRTDYDEDGMKEYASIVDQLYDWDGDVTNNDDPDDIGYAIKLVDQAMAKAENCQSGDAGAGDGFFDTAGTAVQKPRSGYYFADFTLDPEGNVFDNPDGALGDIFPTGYTNGYGMAAHASKYNRTGIKCFIINPEGTVYEKVIADLDFDDTTNLPVGWPDVDADNWILVNE
ncbi:MAG: DUF2950 family protein [Planctomycetes bacterium]|nr:DUF2950 family protein [Planctomycetota bacterium]